MYQILFCGYMAAFTCVLFGSVDTPKWLTWKRLINRGERVFKNHSVLGIPIWKVKLNLDRKMNFQKIILCIAFVLVVWMALSAKAQEPVKGKWRESDQENIQCTSVCKQLRKQVQHRFLRRIYSHFLFVEIVSADEHSKHSYIWYIFIVLPIGFCLFYSDHAHAYIKYKTQFI